jgi:hypothetical protein
MLSGLEGFAEAGEEVGEPDLEIVVGDFGRVDDAAEFDVHGVVAEEVMVQG